MEIFVLAGKKTKNIMSVLSNLNYHGKGCDDLSDGLEQITLIESPDLLILFDEALIIDGNAVDEVEVFKALDELQPVNSEMEILYITKLKELYESFAECMITNSRARCNLVTKLNSKIIDECIKNTYKGEEEREEVKQEAPNINSVVEEPEPEKVEPEPEPEPEPPKPKVMTKPKREPRPRIPAEPKPPKPPKEPKLKRKKCNLGDLLTNNKIIIVTGPHNSGVSSTAVSVASVFADDGVDTIIVDGDIYNKGVNRYYDILDDGAGITHQSGFKNSVDSFDLIDQSLIEVRNNLHLIGTRTETSHKYLEDIYTNMADQIGDLANMLANDFRVVIMHIPIELLLQCNALIKYCDDIIYCGNCTVNGIFDVDRYLGLRHLSTKQKENTVRILHRKLNYILTNVKKNTITPEVWLEYLLNTSGESSLHQYILGYIEHYDGFDDFETTKRIPSDTKKIGADIHLMLEKMLKN